MIQKLIIRNFSSNINFKDARGLSSDLSIELCGPFGIAADLIYSEYETVYNNGLYDIAKGGPIFTCIIE